MPVGLLGEQIKNEYNVASALFNQLTTQLVQAEMKIKEDIPILTVVEPVVVPLSKSSPNSKFIFISFIFIGCVLACSVVFGIEWFRSLGYENKLINRIML